MNVRASVYQGNKQRCRSVRCQGGGDMKLMQLILDYLFYFLALCSLGIPMSTVWAKCAPLEKAADE